MWTARDWGHFGGSYKDTDDGMAQAVLHVKSYGRQVDPIDVNPRLSTQILHADDPRSHFQVSFCLLFFRNPICVSCVQCGRTAFAIDNRQTFIVCDASDVVVSAEHCIGDGFAHLYLTY